MDRVRIRFKKEGTARFISHLDLMRTFQRAFVRSEIALKHTEGFNPHPYISIAHPLPVGFTGLSEILDFILIEKMDFSQIIYRLNASLPDGIKITSCYDARSNLKSIEYADYSLTFTFDSDIKDEFARELSSIFNSKPINVFKRTKSGEREIDISPDILSFNISYIGGNSAHIAARLSCGGRFLNPVYLEKAANDILTYKIISSDYIRTGFFQKDGQIFE